MSKSRGFSAGPLGLAAVAALAVGLVSAGPTFTGQAAAEQNTGTASIQNHTLTVTGTNRPDVVALAADATEVQVTFGNDPANQQRFPLADFNAISVSLGNGDDQFTEPPGILANKALTVDGGNGNDTITTGNGTDVIFGGNGDDHVDAGRGNDTVFLGNGNDFFVWNPGQGSDTVDGGNGNADVMQFNGSDQDETMSLSANGSRAVFLRDIGTIRMDLNAIETLNLNTLGGGDNVTVNNLEGTSLRHANIDLAASSGGGDQATDFVTINGTNQADHVHVTAQDDRVDVAGLQADTQIAGSETRDHLQVNTLDGNDTITVDPNVAPLIGVATDLGLGQP
jgi:Ca2+-binding RTX toxin-like protein